MEEKHRCLVRWIIQIRVKDRGLAHIELNGDGKRWKGWKAKDPQVYEDVLKQWSLGNRGRKGEWHD